jgi:hypothetical protein
MWGFAISAASTATALQVRALAQLQERQFRRHLLREPTGIRWPAKIAVIWAFAALHAIMDTALQLLVGLVEDKATKGLLHFQCPLSKATEEPWRIRLFANEENE